MKELGDVRLIQSYVWHGDTCYFVSTIDRNSSSIHGGRFSETMVWTFDWKKHVRGDRILFSDGGSQTFIGQHLKLCQKIFNGGEDAFKTEET